MRIGLPAAILVWLLLSAGCGGDSGDAGETTAEAASLRDVPWVLSGGLDAEGWESAPPSAAFGAETVGGFAGCNRFTAPYTQDGDSLELGTIATTQMACPPPADGVEREYVDALARVAGWRIDGGSLVLLDDDGADVLRYDPATPVGEWEATAIQNGDAFASPLPGTAITATFGEDGTLTGHAGCNTYRTTYQTDRGQIEIEPPASTRKLCADVEGQMEQEGAYLAALPTATRYRLDGGSLALLRADGTYVATYSRPTAP